MAVLWLGTGCGFSLFASSVNDMFCVENWRGEWMAVLWLGAGCGFSFFGS
jgi:hypothetical protein